MISDRSLNEGRAFDPGSDVYTDGFPINKLCSVACLSCLALLCPCPPIYA